MDRKITNTPVIIKTFLFTVFFLVLFLITCFMFQPLWKEWNNFETIDGFYQEPENTIETVFLGPSTVVNSVSPIELYETFGFCAYNLGMEQQPMLASYFWLKEAYRLHPDTLHVVFLDPCSMRHEQSIAFYQKAIDRMQFSSVKMEAIAAYNKTWNSIIEHSIPILEYHDRWDALVDLDYNKYELKPTGSTRGYNISKSLYIDTKEKYQDLSVHRSWYDPKAAPNVFTKESVEFFEKIVQFCKENHIQLVLFSPPRPTSWASGLHNAARLLADENEIPYYDLNESSFLDEMDFLMGVDHQDYHLNYYGAKKTTKWCGDYLDNEGLNHDISNIDKYAFMDDQLERYRALINKEIKIRNIDNVAEYLREVMTFEHCYVLICVKDEGASSLTSEQRAIFADLGLNTLADIGGWESYIGVIKDGLVKDEICDKTPSTMAAPECYLSYRTDSGIVMKSGSWNRGNISSVLINGVEYSKNQRGINVVVYDYKEDKVYDSVAFDTYISSSTMRNDGDVLNGALEEDIPWYKKEEKVKKIYLYNRRYYNQQYDDYWDFYGDDTSLFAYLNMYNKNPGYAIIISVKDDAASSLSDEARLAFSELGLNNLSGLQQRDSYIGILEDGVPSFEQRNHGEKPINYNEMDLSVTSGGHDSGNISSVLINGNEESLNKRGLNIVVYDKQLQETISSVCFDTCAQTPSIAQELEVKIGA